MNNLIRRIRFYLSGVRWAAVLSMVLAVTSVALAVAGLSLAVVVALGLSAVVLATLSSQG